MMSRGSRDRSSMRPMLRARVGSARSYLYVPGDRADRLAGATTRGADALVADLEDGVAVASKGVARQSVAEWLRTTRLGDRPEIWVRVNAGTFDEDIDAVATASLRGVFVPKASPGVSVQ